MRITQIILDNFQSHQHTEIVPDAGITLITGSSDSGKSSLVRALRWVFFNRAPKGNFMLDRKGITKVTIIYDTGDILIREKGSKTNQYQLNDQIYKALKSDVPSEISSFHKITLDNCQWQHPHYFLLDETPGNVARRLNEVADLSIMDESLKVVNALVREADNQVAAVSATLTGLRDQLKGREWVSAAKKLVDQGSELQRSYDLMYTDQETLQGALETVGKLQRRLETFPDMSGLPHVETAIELCHHREVVAGNSSNLAATIAKAEVFLDLINCMPEIDVDEVSTAIDKIINREGQLLIRNNLDLYINRVEALQDKLNSMLDVDVDVDVDGFEITRRDLTTSQSILRRAITAVTKWQGKLRAVEISLLDVEEAYDALKLELGVCPVCGGDLKPECCK